MTAPAAGLLLPLAALAGLVDAVAFAGFGGFFASFMSGNTTRLGVAWALGDPGDVFVAGALILAFVAGSMVATIAAQAAGDRRGEAVMAVVTAALVVAAFLSGWSVRPIALVALAIAMGAQNGIATRHGEVRVGITYMTGTLVRLGQRLALWMMGVRPDAAWHRDLLLWLGFLAGVALGAACWHWMGGAALWVAAAAAAGLTPFVARAFAAD